MKLTEQEINELNFFGFSSYYNTYIERLRIQLITREFDKLHGFFEIQITKYSKKFKKSKSVFFKYDNPIKLFEILKNNGNIRK